MKQLEMCTDENTALFPPALFLLMAKKIKLKVYRRLVKYIVILQDKPS